ncbi:short-chain dehydrogenase [Mycolicibacterium chubuense]|uniref:Putative oxidoreductase n=1 Tax=Mycolicibacterium chubuense TaxID=1800 RepID=A0A0J6VFC2_MYCCU|nr:SDR family oxidoreductase [Mycolicibacterium chubuense]KMO69715.1 putative oxidoreductase [Mycolicibacterium chubuense]ORA43249.1 short-chain dehydrogenase [Mycolicibacterium chubuense]SPX99398.1 short chain dehydrogenase [Mycolicibacterium chubuense]
MTDLSGKTYLVVGASGALGSRIARRLADRGADLTVTGRSADALAEIGDAHTVTADLRDPDAGRTVVEAAREQHGRLDGVVIAAGVVAFGPLTEIDDDTVDDLVLVDFLAPLRVLRAALPVLEPGGVILNVSAVVAEKPLPNMAVYSAVKAATAALFTAARTEARRRKVRVVDVRPPHTETGLAGRAIAGDPPRLPTGLDPDAVAERIVAALVDDETDVPSTAF